MDLLRFPHFCIPSTEEILGADRGLGKHLWASVSTKAESLSNGSHRKVELGSLRGAGSGFRVGLGHRGRGDGLPGSQQAANSLACFGCVCLFFGGWYHQCIVIPISEFSQNF